MTVQLPDRFEDGLAYLINHVVNDFRQQFMRECTKAGMRITPEEMAVLILLHQEDGQMQSELAAGLGKDKAIVTRLLASLHERGYIRRETDDDDRRVIRACLTDEGRKAFAVLNPLSEDYVLRALGGVSQEAFDTTRQTLRTIIANLAAMKAES